MLHRDIAFSHDRRRRGHLSTYDCPRKRLPICRPWPVYTPSQGWQLQRSVLVPRDGSITGGVSEAVRVTCLLSHARVKPYHVGILRYPPLAINIHSGLFELALRCQCASAGHGLCLRARLSGICNRILRHPGRNPGLHASTLCPLTHELERCPAFCR